MLCFVEGLGGWVWGFFVGWVFKAVAHMEIWTHFSRMTSTIKSQYFLLSSVLV